MKLTAAASAQPKITKDEDPVKFKQDEELSSPGLISDGNTKVKETPSQKAPKKQKSDELSISLSQMSKERRVREQNESRGDSSFGSSSSFDVDRVQNELDKK